MNTIYLHTMKHIYNCSHIAEVVVYSSSRTGFIWLSSKLELNFDLILDSLSSNCHQLTMQSLVSVEPVLVERFFFHFQASISLFTQDHVYLKMFQSRELQVNEFDKFQLSAVQNLHFKRFGLDFCKFFVLAMF